jgi:hypothetical protein
MIQSNYEANLLVIRVKFNKIRHKNHCERERLYKRTDFL